MDKVSIRILAAGFVLALLTATVAGAAALLGWRQLPPACPAAPSRVIVLPPAATPPPAQARPLQQADRHSWRMP